METISNHWDHFQTGLDRAIRLIAGPWTQLPAIGASVALREGLVDLLASYDGPLDPGERLTAVEGHYLAQTGKDCYVDAPPFAGPGIYQLRPVQADWAKANVGAH